MSRQDEGLLLVDGEACVGPRPPVSHDPIMEGCFFFLRIYLNSGRQNMFSNFPNTSAVCDMNSNCIGETEGSFSCVVLHMNQLERGSAKSDLIFLHTAVRKTQ